MTHDCIVIGAGPGGSAAARILAESGSRVLLLEKQRLGRDKPCGGGLTPRAYGDLGVPIDDLVAARTGAAEIRGASRAFRVSFAERPVLMVRRRDLDRRLAEAAATAGAEVHDAEPAIEVEAPPPAGPVRVRTARAVYSAAVVLLATGAEAPLRTALGFGATAGRMAPAIEMEGPAWSPRLDRDVFVFDYSVPRGYAWAFPKGDWWNAGVVTAHPEAGRQLRRRLAAFLEACDLTFHEQSPDRAAGRRIPMWGGPRTLQHGRVALVGDAAGLADPFFGEGIAAALASGRLAAGAALEVLTGRSADLAPYEPALRRSLEPHLARMRWLSRSVYPMPRVALRALSAATPLQRLAARLATESFRAA